MMKTLYSETVLKLAKWLDGGAVVVIGGRERAWIKARIQRAFQLKRVDWDESHPKQAPDTLESAIRRPDVVLVISVLRSNGLLIRLVKEMCARNRKLLVMAPGASGEERLAAEIMAQAGEQLKQRYEQRHQREDE